MNGIFRKIIPTRGLSKLDDRFASVWLEGIGGVIVDAQERTLTPTTPELADTVKVWAWENPRQLVQNLDKVERAADEIFGEKPWQWRLDLTRGVCTGCCA